MKYRILLFTPLLLLCSCNHYFYSPNTQNVPMLREKNEARAMAGGFSADEIDGFEAQLAYSPANHLGITFNYISAKGGSGYDRGNGHQVEGGIGYYQPIDRRFTFEAYAGFGGGSIYNQYDSTEAYSLRFTKIFIQPAIGYTSDYFDAVFSLRLSYLSLKSDDIVNTMYSAHSALYEVETTPHSFLFEPAVTIRGGWKYIKVQTQFGVSQNFTNLSFPQEETIFSIGLYGSFTPRWLAGKKGKPAAGL